MASTRKQTTKDGKVFYEISVSRGRGKSRLTRRWYPQRVGVRNPLNANWPLSPLSLSAKVTPVR